MKVTAIDVAILPPEPVKGLAIELSKQISPDFHLNEADILPHITLGIGFVKEFQISNFKFQISNIVAGLRPFEVVVDRIDGRYLICKNSDELYGLHKAICDGVEFVHLDREGILKYTVPCALCAKVQDDTYAGEKVSEGTIDFTNNFKWRNAYENFVPHVTIGWDDTDKSKVKVRSEKWGLPMKFMASEVSICRLGDKNTCRKVMARLPLG